MLFHRLKKCSLILGQDKYVRLPATHNATENIQKTFADLVMIISKHWIRYTLWFAANKTIQRYWMDSRMIPYRDTRGLDVLCFSYYSYLPRHLVFLFQWNKQHSPCLHTWIPHYYSVVNNCFREELMFTPTCPICPQLLPSLVPPVLSRCFGV